MAPVSTAKKYYVVWKGRRTGLFSSWEECSAQVTGFTGAQYKGFATRRAAEEALRGSYADYQGRPAGMQSPAQLLRPGGPIPHSYCVDAACSGSPGPLEYRCVHTASRRLLFKQGPFADGTNNIGEFLAIVHALALLAEKDPQAPIYSDSATALAWVRAGKCNTRLAPGSRNAALFELIQRAEAWLADHSFANPLLKWDTNAWGEIPADFGRK